MDNGTSLRTSLRRLNKYLENDPLELSSIENQFNEISDFIGFPEDGINFGHNIVKLLFITAPLRELGIAPDSLNLLDSIEVKLKENNYESPPRFPEKNKSSKAPYSTSSFPIYKEIDYLPADIGKYSVNHYLQLQFIRITLHLRLSRKYESSQFYYFFQNYKQFIFSLIKKFPNYLTIELVSDYQQFLNFVDKKQDEILSLSDDALKLINYVKHVKSNSHKTPQDKPGCAREDNGDGLNDPLDNLPEKRSDRFSKEQNSQRGNVEQVIERNRLRAAKQIIFNDESSSEEDRSVVLFSKISDEGVFDGTESVYEDLSRENIQVEEKLEGESVSASWNKKAANRSKIKTLNRAQFLKLDWNALTDIERNLIVDESLREFESGAEVSIGAFGTLFTLTVGAEPMFWGGWLLCKDENEPYINLKNGCYSHYCEFEDGRWLPESEQLSKLEHQGHNNERVELPLEDHLYLFLKGKFSNHKTVSAIFNLTLKEIQDLTDEWIKKVIKKLNSSRWFTTKRVRDDLFFQVMFATYDEPMANHICAQNVYEMPIGVTYAQFSQSRLLNTYLSVQHPKLSFSQQPDMSLDDVIGSWLFPSKVYLKSFVEKLKSEYLAAVSVVDKSASIEQVVQAHNAFVSYLLFAGFVGTSTRPNDDPYPHQQVFLMELNALLITDKVIGYENETRISIFSDTFKEIMNAYQEQLKSLRFWLAALGYKKEAGMVLSAESFEQQQIPYVFYLDLKGSELTISSITRDVLDKKMPELIYLGILVDTFGQLGFVS